MQSLDRRATRRELHYSSAMSISLSDAHKVQEELLQFLAHLDQRMALSKEEEGMVLNIDWFTL